MWCAAEGINKTAFLLLSFFTIFLIDDLAQLQFYQPVEFCVYVIIVALVYVEAVVMTTVVPAKSWAPRLG